MIRSLFAPLAATGLATLAAAGPAGAQPASSARPFAVETVGAFEAPWAIAFLSDGRALVTEKKGKLKLWQSGGSVTDIAGVPAVATTGQSGLFDIALAPDFASSRRVYLTYAEPRPNGSSMALARATLDLAATGGRLDDFQVIWRQGSDGAGGHYGAIIAFAPDGRHLFLTSGDRQRFAPAQDMNQRLGKVLRLTLDGKPAPGNPAPQSIEASPPERSRRL